MAHDREKMINQFVAIREYLMESLSNKYTALEELKKEIDRIKQEIRDIEKFIGSTSFLSAAAMLEKEDIVDKAENSKLSDVDFTRKIFSEKDEELLLTIVKFDGKRLEIYFPNPQVIKLKSTSELYVLNVIEPLMALKEEEPDMKVEINKENDQDIITKLSIKGVESYESAERIYYIFENIVKDNIFIR